MRGQSYLGYAKRLSTVALTLAGTANPPCSLLDTGPQLKALLRLPQLAMMGATLVSFPVLAVMRHAQGSPSGKLGAQMELEANVSNHTGTFKPWARVAQRHLEQTEGTA